MIRTTIAALAALALAAPAAQAAPDRTFQLDDKTLSATATSASGSGVNVSYFLEEDDAVQASGCSADPQQKCETTLVEIGAETTKKSLTITMDGFQTQSDYDLRVYKAKPDGTKQGDTLGSPTAAGNGPFSPVLGTFFGDFESFTVSNVKPGSKYLVEVVYFTVVNDKYTVTATLK
jgi:hypothetical protein